MENEQLSLLDDDFGRMLVSQSNTLIQASYDLTTTEKKIFVACAAKVNSRFKITADTPFEFSISEAQKILGLSDTRRLWDEYEKACQGLMDKQFMTWDEEKQIKVHAVFAHTAKFNYKEKKFTLYFSTGIIPYLSNLQKHFTKYRLLHIGQFSSKYAIRLYEKMVMTLNEKRVNAWTEVLSLNEVRELFCIEGQYDKYHNLKKRVLEPAIKQITDNTDIATYFEEEKPGRSVTGIRFNYAFKRDWIDAEERLKNERYVLSDEDIEEIKKSNAFMKKYLPEYQKNKAEELGVELVNSKQFIFDFLIFVERKLQTDPTYFPDYRKYINK